MKLHWRLQLLGATLVAAALAWAPAAHAEPARGSYLPADLSRVHLRSPGSAESHSSNIIYLNGCFGSGCDITPGDDSSIDNTSSIITSTGHLDAFTGSDEEWQAIVDCVRDTYAPFDIIITDEDPSPADHFEAIVAGSPEQIGMPMGVGGVAPYVCGETINNAITYTFSTFIGNDIAQTCWTIAQESAHAFGLDHELLCSDPMTYLNSCDPLKRFQNQDAPCGEYQARACQCNGPKQNSYAYLLEHFGAGIPTPPSVAITSPADGAQVELGFIVRVDAVDDLRVDRVELRVNHQLVGTAESEPFIFNVPELSDGRMQVEVTAFDNYDYSASASIEVVQGEPCRKSSNCASLEVCVAGRCVPGPEVEGGLGQSCTDGLQCISGDCGHSSEGSYCTETCGQGLGGCPSGFGCLDTGDRSVCWPGYKQDGGCSVASVASSANWLLALLMLALARRRR